jgi:hypothetical protein
VELLLYILGPVLLLALPAFVLIVSVGLGFITPRNVLFVVVLALLLPLFCALATPSYANLSSTTEWPAPWVLAAFLGNLSFDLRAFLYLVSAAFACFLIGFALQYLFRKK